MADKIRSKLWIILLYASFHLNMMSCSIYTDSLTGWVWASYRIKELAMIVGFICFSLSRKLVRDHLKRKILLLSGNILYTVSLIIIMFGKDPAVISILSILAMFLIGYTGGWVYYYVSLGIFKFEYGGLIVALATSLAYITHYILWVVLAQESIMVVVMLAGFAVVAYIVIKPAADWIYMDPLPYSDGSDKQEIRIEKKQLVLLICLTAIALISVDRTYEIFTSNYGDIVGSVYGITRLTAIPVSLIIGYLFDKKRHDIMSVLMLFAMVIRIWLPTDFTYENLLIIAYQASEIYIYLFISVSFWEIAPETKRPELWASFGRVLMCTGLLYEAVNSVIPHKGNTIDNLMDFVLFFMGISLVIMELSNRQERILEQKIKTAASSKNDDESHILNIVSTYNLTPRETDVVRELLQNPDLQIQTHAEHLGISRTMFYRYINQLYEKTGTSDKNALLSKLEKSSADCTKINTI